MYERKIRELELVHRELDTEIAALTASQPNDSKISELKKKRLHLLDQLRSLRRQQYEYNQEVRFDNE